MQLNSLTQNLGLFNLANGGLVFVLVLQLQHVNIKIETFDSVSVKKMKSSYLIKYIQETAVVI